MAATMRANQVTEADMRVEDKATVLRKPVRDSWADAAKRLSDEGDDILVMGDFGNEDDAEQTW